MKTHLALESMTLAARSRILKRLAHKAPHAELRKGFHNEAVHENRINARAAHIALGFLRGRKLSKMEMPYRALDQGHITSKNLSRSFPNWEKVEKYVHEHGSTYFENQSEMLQRLTEFKDEGSIVRL